MSFHSHLHPLYLSERLDMYTAIIKKGRDVHVTNNLKVCTYGVFTVSFQVPRAGMQRPSNKNRATVPILLHLTVAKQGPIHTVALYNPSIHTICSLHSCTQFIKVNLHGPIQFTCSPTHLFCPMIRPTSTIPPVSLQMNITARKRNDSTSARAQTELQYISRMPC